MDEYDHDYGLTAKELAAVSLSEAHPFVVIQNAIIDVASP